uniref:CAP-Gly domain-containing protein n=1 Tax=Macrostomum lignano TaxID=282301 RepID=A0A1I8FCT9_9PLAT
TSKPPPAAAPQSALSAAAASATSTSSSKPPPTAPARPRQSRAEQLLRDLDADIERDRQIRGRRSYSADRATVVVGTDDSTTKEHQQALAAASQTVARHQRLQTPPPMHYYSSSSGGQKSKSADEATVVSKSEDYRDARAAPVLSSTEDQPATALTPRSEQKRQTVVKIVESDRQFASSGRDSAATVATAQSQGPRLSSEDSQRLLDRLLLEKETMATELNQLRQQQQQQRPVGGQFPSGRALERQQQQQYATLPEYDPESPSALKRRIVDLEQQILDLQEANETLKLASSPRRQWRRQSGANRGRERLRARLDQVTVENEALKNELNRLRQQREQPDMEFIRAELDSLRAELDVLRDRNYQLERENRRLLETGSPFFAADPYGLAGSNQFLYNDDRQHEFEPETRPYYGSLGRSPQPHQPHHRQQRQSRIGDKMRGTPWTQSSRQQRQQQQAEQQEAGQSRTPSRTFHSSSGPAQLLSISAAANGTPLASVRWSRPFSSSRSPPLVGCRSLQKQAADIRSGDLVKFTRYGGRISKGLVHFVGRLPGRTDYYVGIELDQEEGKHDGVYDGRRYFQCKPRKGVFVAFNKLIMCYQAA